MFTDNHAFTVTYDISVCNVLNASEEIRVKVSQSFNFLTLSV